MLLATPFARSTGEGEGGWFPAPQPMLVGLGAPVIGDAVFRILRVRTKCCRLLQNFRWAWPHRHVASIYRPSAPMSSDRAAFA